MNTRKDYVNGKCTHRQYYAQFVDDNILTRVWETFGERLLKSNDEHLNDIPIREWDNLGLPWGFRGRSYSECFKYYGDGISEAGIVCVLKEAARQLIESKGREVITRFRYHNPYTGGCTDFDTLEEAKAVLESTKEYVRLTDHRWKEYSKPWIEEIKESKPKRRVEE